MRTITIAMILLCIAGSVFAQEVKIETLDTTGVTSSLRGICAVDENVVWASGSGGRWLRSLDGGSTWDTGQIKGSEDLDFRDVEAFSEEVAIIISAGSPGRIYKTVDGGKTWDLKFEDNRKEAFYNAMAFWDKQRGFAIGDPVDGRFAMIFTDDGGETWVEVVPETMPTAVKGEAQFAASGTCLFVGNEKTVWFCTGGGDARVWRSDDYGKNWAAFQTPLSPDTASQGLFSLAFFSETWGVAVGGDYQNPGSGEDNYLVTRDGGVTWYLPEERPAGYRSAIAIVDEIALVAVGRGGLSISFDGGETWKDQDISGYYALSMVAKKQFGFICGADGKIAKITMP